MSSDGNDVRAFQCPNCEKKLKAPAKAVGRSVSCPKCGQAIVVPAVSGLSAASAPAEKPVATKQPSPLVTSPNDLLALNVPAILDISEREQASADVKAEKAKQREANRRRNAPQGKQGVGKLQPVDQRPKQVVSRTAPANPNSARNEGAIPFDSDEELFEQAGNKQQPGSSPAPKNTAPAAGKNPAEEAPRSVFDEDLPDLAQWNETAKAPSSIDKVLAAHLPESSAEIMEDLNSMIPDVGTLAKKKPLYEAPVKEEEGEYRVVCKTCGTAQYVAPSVSGMKVKCPDCFIEFKVPPPPSDWNPKKKKKLELSQEDMPLAEAEALAHAQSDNVRRERTASLLEKAKREISDEDLEKLYDGDFDTAGFVHRTFGFLRDVIVIAQIVGYGIVFAILFAVAQISANDTEGFFGRGLLLLSVILIPMVGLLFALPMLSGGLSLIESVGNKQRQVTEVPGFNLFENFGDVVLITVSLAAAVVPGYLVGMLLGGNDIGAMQYRISGMMISCFALFPLFLLSMLDNGSLFQPVSGSVLRSLKDAAEAWGGYYIKTLVAFFCVLVFWLLLLGKTPLLAAIAGFLLPLLVFFTCQQIGSLADAISDHLSYEFTPPSKDDDKAEGEIEDD